MYYSNIVVKPEVTPLSIIELIERERLLGRIELPDPNSDYKIRAAIYGRLSTGPQADEDKGSREEQKEAGLKVIRQNDWEFVAIYEDIKATSYEEKPEEREGLSKALEAARRGLFDVLVIWIDSRLGRNSEETKLIRKLFNNLGVQIYSVKRPLPIKDPRFFYPGKDKFNKVMQAFSDLTSENESAEFSARMEFGKARRARKGFVPCKVGFGYKKKIKVKEIDGSEKIIRITIPMEKELQIIRKMFDFYLHQGFGVRKIVEWLNGNGHKTRNGKKWCYSSVRYILKNPVYAGKVRWGWRLSESKASRQRLMKGHTGIISDGYHKAAISEKDFIKVQKKFAARVKMGGRAVSSKGLLTGVLKCGRCGSKAYVTSYPSSYAYQKHKEGKPKEDYSRCYAYFCSRVSAYGNKACKRYIGSQRKIEGYVVNQIKTLASSPEAQKAFQEEIRRTNTKHLKTKIQSLKNALRELPEMRSRCSVAYREGVMGLEDYGKNLGELEQKENKIKVEIKQTEKEIAESKMTQGKIKKAIKAFRDFDVIWNKAGFEKKKDLIRDIIKEVRVTSRKIEVTFNVC